MSGTVVAIVLWQGRWVCWNLNRNDNRRMNSRWRLRAIAFVPANCLSESVGQTSFRFFRKILYY